MIRTLAGLGLTLALVGSAHAQDTQLTVSTYGKSRSVVRAELYRAAEKVCASDANLFDPSDATCVEETYARALQQLRAAPRVERTAYVEASPASLR